MTTPIFLPVTDLILRLVNGIIRQEGMPADHTNPTNCRDCPWFPGHPGTPTTPPIRVRPDGTHEQFVKSGSGWMWVPKTREEGLAGGFHVVSLRVAEEATLRSLISVWAPPEDGNDTEAYIAHLKEWAVVPDENAVLWTYLILR